MLNKRILVVGSSNTDMVIKTKKFPVPGETILGGHFFMNPGGKGANQAVAAKRLGGQVSFVGKIGNDIFGKQAMQLLADEGILVDHIATDHEKPSGVAMITVDAKGENSIVVAPGSNSTLSPEDFDQAKSELDNSGIVLLQLETPMETVVHVATTATIKGKKVILNPAPADQLPENLLKNIFLITPNETEAELLTGIKIHDMESAREAALILQEKGVQVVIITMGEAGAFVLSDEFTGMIQSPKVTAIDTTAAGDTFNGALVVALTEELNLKEAVAFACKAASVSVTRIGAQSSIPHRKEIEV